MYARKQIESHRESPQAIWDRLFRPSLGGSIERQSRSPGHYHHMQIPRVTFSPSNACVLSSPSLSGFETIGVCALERESSAATQN